MTILRQPHKTYPLIFENRQVGECEVEIKGLDQYSIHWQLFDEFRYLDDFYNKNKDRFDLAVGLDSKDRYKIVCVDLVYTPERGAPHVSQ